MPEYFYTCACGYSEKIIHSILENPTVLCVDCGEDMKRKPQLGAVTFKGTGFYSNESKAKD